MAKKNTERNAEIAALHLRGMTVLGIAQQFGISKQRVSQLLNPEKTRARDALGVAVSNGTVERPDNCSLCLANGTVHGHHADYARPLDVTWLCSRCHALTHTQPKTYVAWRVGQVRGDAAYYRALQLKSAKKRKDNRNTS